MTTKKATSPTPPRIGDRVVLVNTTEPYTELQPGAVGTVTHTDDAGTVHVDWDTGATLGLVPGVDSWRALHPRWDAQPYVEICPRCGDPLVPGCCPLPHAEPSDASPAEEADR